MHCFDREQRVRLIHGRLCREVYAVTRFTPRPFAVFREWEDGRRESRNIYLRPIAGWLFAAPGDRFEYGSGHVCAEPWTTDAPKNAVCWDYLTADEESVVAEAHPSFRWCLRKAVERGYNGAEIFALLRAFKADPRVELLVGASMKHLALSAGFRRLSKRLQQDVARWAIQNGDYGLRAALDCLRERISVGEWNEWRSGEWRNMNYKTFRYLKTRNVYPWEYREYLRTVQEVGKDPSDEYWKYPSNFRARRRSAERMWANLQKAKEEAERRKREQELIAVASKFDAGTFDGIRVWVPTSVEEFAEQAQALDQCLMTMDYAGKVARGDCVLVFLAQRGKPLATAELLKRSRGWRVGQFYGDERLENYLAGKRERNALLDWAGKNKLALKISA